MNTREPVLDEQARYEKCESRTAISNEGDDGSIVSQGWQPTYFARFGFAFPPDALKATAERMRVLNAAASTVSPSWMSIARLRFPSRLELNSFAGSFNEAPLAKVNFTVDL